jgi:hypothetical protein
MQTRILFGNWVISEAVDLGIGLSYMDGKLRHRPKTFMGSLRFKKAVFKSKL